jgi:hypothetical protein
MIVFNYHAQFNRNICYILVYTSTYAFPILLGYSLWLYYLALHYLLTRGCDHLIGRCRDKCASDLNISRNKTLGYRNYWKPYLNLNPIFIKKAHKAIARLSLSHFMYLVGGEIFSAPETAFDRLQNYAMFYGFRIVVKALNWNKTKTQVMKIRSSYY